MSALNLRIPDQLDHQLRLIAEQNQMSLSEFVRQTLQEALIRMEKEQQLQEMEVAATWMAQSTAYQTQQQEFENDYLITESDFEKLLRSQEKES